jgi:hypothetical protein
LRVRGVSVFKTQCTPSGKRKLTLAAFLPAPALPWG